jgi:hypothetical protein
MRRLWLGLGRGSRPGEDGVTAITGQVWYHSWHGRFIARDDA